MRWLEAPKPGGGSRRLVRLSDDDERRYRRLVARVAPAIERSLMPGVLANRASTRRGPSVLAPWRPARRRWERSLRRASAAGATIVVADVVACYEEIHPTAVRRALERAGGAADDVDAVGEWLRGAAAAGIPGLPVGPEPSAVLANVVLAAGDRALDDVGVRWMRWVDDWVIEAADPRHAARALRELGDALAGVGLRLHEGKTGARRDPRGAATSPASGPGDPAHGSGGDRVR